MTFYIIVPDMDMPSIEPHIIIYSNEVVLYPLNLDRCRPELSQGCVMECVRELQLKEFEQCPDTAIWTCRETIETEDIQGNPIMLFKLEVTGHFVVLVIIPMGLEVAGVTG